MVAERNSSMVEDHIAKSPPDRNMPDSEIDLKCSSPNL